VLADQVKSLDWRVRKAEFICNPPPETTNEVLDKLAWRLGDKTPLYPSSLNLIRKYFAAMDLDDEALSLILSSEGYAGKPESLQLYTSHYGLERCTQPLLQLVRNVQDPIIAEEAVKLFRDASEPTRAEVIFHALRHRGENVRAKAVELLGGISTGWPYIPVIEIEVIRALHDRSPVVRTTAISAASQVLARNKASGRDIDRLVVEIGGLLSDESEEAKLYRCLAQRE
jgi:HEAT repeat protein